MALLVVLSARCATSATLVGTGLSNLGFGQIVTTASAGTVTISSGGGRSASGGVVLGSSFGVGASSFAVTGDANASYSITLPSSCTPQAGGATMMADLFTSAPNGSGNLGPSGTQTVSLGATLHVGSGQAAGAYSAAYFITLAYN
jgi:hypothetical protein